MKIIYIFFLIISTNLVINAQMLAPEVIASGGDYFSNASASISITIGEVVTETAYADNTILTQGFQQGHYFAVSISHNGNKNIKAEVFPQPANKDLFIRMSIMPAGKLFFEITEITGKTINKGEITEQLFKIDVSEYASGLYLLNIESTDNFRQCFRIIKE